MTLAPRKRRKRGRARERASWTEMHHVLVGAEMNAPPPSVSVNDSRFHSLSLSVPLANVGMNKVWMQYSYFIQSLFKQCSNNVQIQTLFIFCSNQSVKIQISFIVCSCPKVQRSSGRISNSYSVQIILKNSNYVQVLFIIQTLFKLQFIQMHLQNILGQNFFHKFKLCSNFVSNSYFVQTLQI